MGTTGNQKRRLLRAKMGRVGEGVPEEVTLMGTLKVLGERCFEKRGAKESIYMGIAMGSTGEKESWGVTGCEAEWLRRSDQEKSIGC